ncbi:MAG: L,D-transpeptidase [Patescibacteria group bacterium]|jgi:hypothetical protein
MRVKFVILLSLILLLAFQILQKNQPTTVFKTGVRVGDTDLSGKTWAEGKKLIDGIFDKPIYLNIENTSRAITLKEIGIEIDTDVLARFTKVCRVSKPNMFCKITSNEPVDSSKLIKKDDAKLEGYLNSLEEEFQFAAKNTIIDFEDYSFRTLSPNAKILIDRSTFTEGEKINDLISTERIKIRLGTTTEDDKGEQQEETLKLIDKMTRPLLIKYGGTPIYIPGEEVGNFIITEDRKGLLFGVVSSPVIRNYLLGLKSKYESKDVKLMDDEAINSIGRALLYRAADPATGIAVILPIEGNPRSDGSLHDVYLEVIKPQQRLYRFEGGKLVKTYIVSTGLTWDTPAGEYTIQGKQKMTISYFGNWYMPDYLPVGTINGGYRFGFHAIPYHMDAAGNIFSRDISTMGSPATGGCIQLKPAEATELFDWAKVGTPVYIYD